MSGSDTIRDAATVVLLRDVAGGLEVLLLERHAGHVFGAGAHVFPGGALDPADAAPALAGRCAAGRDYAQACLGEIDRSLAYWMAAARECFEEAGVLVGCQARAQPTDARRAAARAALNAGRTDWAAVAADLDLVFTLDELVYFAHWTTPAGAPRRYATRFFAARLAAGETAACDGVETVAERWCTPAEALAAYDRGDMPMMSPTRATLNALCDYEDAESALADLVERGLARA